MKHLNTLQPTLGLRIRATAKSLAALAAAAALLGGAIGVKAQSYTGDWTNTFDTASSTMSWCWWYDMMQHITNNATSSPFTYNELITNSWDSSMNSTLGP